MLTTMVLMMLKTVLLNTSITCEKTQRPYPLFSRSSGKTSLGESVAKATGREFVRLVVYVMKQKFVDTVVLSDAG